MRKCYLIILAAMLICLSSNTYSQNSKTKISNKEFVRKAMTDLFIIRDITAVDKYWSTEYIQHNPQFPNGRQVLKDMLPNLPVNYKYEIGFIMEENQFVMVQGRASGLGPKPMIVIDILKVKDGKIVEHWDILQEEVPIEQTKSGSPMFPIK